MVLVDGSYCKEPVHECRKWLDDPKLPFARCGEYAEPARCRGERIDLRFCIDKHEHTEPGERLPLNHQSFVLGAKICKDLGKRLCTESEWNFACEGETMQPYPYGWSRRPVCNQDRTDLYQMVGGKQTLRDLRRAPEELPECVSPFGVYDMVGNLDEPVRREDRGAWHPFRNALKGGWWMAGRNRCRPATTAHDEYYKDIQIGIRCCADAPR
jgi:formylglycine-generating enzyme required for sulfatase activity